MVYRPKQKDATDSQEVENPATSRQEETTTSHTVEVSHKAVEEPQKNYELDEEEKDNEDLLRKAANASKDLYGSTPQKQEKKPVHVP